MKETRQHLELKMVQENKAVTAVNVESLMPPDWQQQIRNVVEECGKLVRFRGGEVDTSRAPSSFVTVYRVVTGYDIEPRLPWLWKLYQGPFLELVQKVAGRELEPDPDKKYSPNINTLTKGHKYEPHDDLNHWTGMVAATTVHEGDGGELTHELSDHTTVETRVRAGWIYIFDGLNHTHGVNKLKSDIRITLPMNYNFKGVKVERPSNLKAIFGEKNGEK